MLTQSWVDTRSTKEMEGQKRRLSLSCDGKREWIRACWFPKWLWHLARLLWNGSEERTSFCIFLLYALCKYLLHSHCSFSHLFIQQMCMEINVYVHKHHPQFYWHIVLDCPLWHIYNNSAFLACGKLPINKNLLVWLIKKPMNLWMNARMDQ